jgi:hypothetical protein
MFYIIITGPFWAKFIILFHLYVCLGNHEGENDYYKAINPPNNLAILATLWRKNYYIRTLFQMDFIQEIQKKNLLVWITQRIIIHGHGVTHNL